MWLSGPVEVAPCSAVEDAPRARWGGRVIFTERSEVDSESRRQPAVSAARTAWALRAHLSARGCCWCRTALKLRAVALLS
jgi:hypothetical protein